MDAIHPTPPTTTVPYPEHADDVSNAPMRTNEEELRPDGAKTQLPCSNPKSQQPHSHKRDSTPSLHKHKHAYKVSGTSDNKPSPQPP